MWIFLGTIAVVATLGYFENLRPSFDSKADAKIVQIVKDKEVLAKFDAKNGTIDAKVSSYKESVDSKSKAKVSTTFEEIKLTTGKDDAKKQLLLLKQMVE